MTTKPKLSVAIPTSEMVDRDRLFKRLMRSLWNQSFQDFEIVVSDNSEDDGIEEICDFYKTGIRYFKNPKQGMAQNHNNAIQKSEGEIIKIIQMDDYFAHDSALERIILNFNKEWMISACEHQLGKRRGINPHYPKWSDDQLLGNNTLGGISTLTIKNDNPMFFDENMSWLVDCDLYQRYYDKFGEPVLLNDINVVVDLRDTRLTHTLSDELKAKEREYLIKKYDR